MLEHEVVYLLPQISSYCCDSFPTKVERAMAQQSIKLLLLPDTTNVPVSASDPRCYHIHAVYFIAPSCFDLRKTFQVFALSSVSGAELLVYAFRFVQT